jgi:hypothetical protein
VRGLRKRGSICVIQITPDKRAARRSAMRAPTHSGHIVGHSERMAAEAPQTSVRYTDTNTGLSGPVPRLFLSEVVQIHNVLKLSCGRRLHR